MERIHLEESIGHLKLHSWCIRSSLKVSNDFLLFTMKAADGPPSGICIRLLCAGTASLFLQFGNCEFQISGLMFIQESATEDPGAL